MPSLYEIVVANGLISTSATGTMLLCERGRPQWDGYTFSSTFSGIRAANFFLQGA